MIGSVISDTSIYHISTVRIPQNVRDARPDVLLMERDSCSRKIADLIGLNSSAWIEA